MHFKCKKEKEEKEIPVPENIVIHSTWIRLENQIKWYDERSIRSQKCYKRIKFLQIVLAVGIPVLSHIEFATIKWIISGAGALIAILESVQHMNQYSTLWVTYRSTAEHLKHEKFLFLAAAGPYRELDEHARLILLAERVEENVSTEHANWFNETRKANMGLKGKEKDGKE